MNEFLNINWRPKDISKLEPQNIFITEETAENSMIYKYFENPNLLRNQKRIKVKKQYVPGQAINLNTIRKSSLDNWAHQQCLKALKLFQNGKDPNCYTTSEKFVVDIFTKLKPKIYEEYSLYQAHVQDHWNKIGCQYASRIKSSIVSYGEIVWRRKWEKLGSYPQFYEEHSMINMTFNENDSSIEFQCVDNVLDVGSVAQFAHPTLKSAFMLQPNSLPSPELCNHYSKLPVSEDPNVSKILETHNIDLVTSMSTIKCLTDTSDLKRRWMIPVIIKLLTFKNANGVEVKKKVVFLDKPLSKYEASNVDLAQVAYKRLLKTSFCQYEGFKHRQQSCDLNNSVHQDSKNEQNNLHYNASYKIWNIKKSHTQVNLMKNAHKPVEFNVLVRGKVDACEGNESNGFQPVILNPKLETQLKFGSTIPSKSELSKEWISLFFTPFSNLYRIRLLPNTGEVINVEKCSIQKIASDFKTHYQLKPQMALGVLQQVFESVIKLEPNNYVMQHLPKYEAFVGIFKEATKCSAKGQPFNFHCENEKITINPLPKTWLPIDVNFILPAFDAENRMPGMFTPKVQTKQKGKKKGFNKNGKKAKEKTN